MKTIQEILPHVKLHFNINHPSFEECYSFGYECLQAEISEDENPFAEGTRENEYWQEGWWDAFYGHAPKHELATIEEYELVSNAANDPLYNESIDNFIIRILEISGMIAVSAFVGYQLLDLVA